MTRPDSSRARPITRRQTLIGGAAVGAAFSCEPLAAVIVPRQGCGCPRIHKLSYGHTCTVHDATGKRWDAYTIEDVARECRVTCEPAQEEWSCYCGDHPHNDLPVGVLCVWERTSYECDEWECRCAESYRQNWLHAVSTDWIAMAKEEGFA